MDDHNDDTPQVVQGMPTTGAPLPGLVSLAQAAADWDVSVRTLRRRIAAGDLPGAVMLPSPAGDAWHVVPLELEQLGYQRRDADTHDQDPTDDGTTLALVSARAMLDDLLALLDRERTALADAEKGRRDAAVDAATARAELAAAQAAHRVELEHLQAERDRVAAELAAATQRRRWLRRAK
jgi:hypothetical protein